MTLSLIQTLKITWYNAKHTKRIKLHFHKANFAKHAYFFKSNDSFEAAFSAYFYGPPLAGLTV